jgi:PAS domain S-box-containing protein
MSIFISLHVEGILMASKPTYEELEQRIKELEEESSEHKRVEKAIDESDQKFRILAEASMVGIFIFQDMKFTYVNPAVTTIFEDSVENMLKKGPMHYTHPDYHQASEKYIMSQLSANPDTKPFILKGLKANGQEIYGEVQGRGLEYQGKPAIIGTLVDITERKQAEKAFRKSEEKFRKIVESSPMGMHMYKLEPNGQLVFIDTNPAADTILGVDNKQFIGKTIEEAFPHLVNTEVPSRYRRVCDLGEPWDAERIVYKDEQIQGVFEVHAFQTGEDTMATMFFDITERKLAEEALRQSEEKYKTLTNNLYVGIYRNTVGPEGSFLEANPAIVKMFGYQSRDEFLSVRVADLYQNPEDRKKFNEKMVRKGRVINEELHLKKKDGTPFIGSVSTVAVKNEKGEVKYYDGVIENITERRQLESQLRHAQRMEAIGTLAGGIAHDFNNILAAVLGYTEIALNGGDVPSFLKSNLQEVLIAGNRAKDLVKQILAFSRQSEHEMIHVQIKSRVKEVLKLLRASIPTTIEIHHNINSEAVVLADPTQIHQVVMNLCTNAEHAMRKTGGILEVSLTEKELPSEFTNNHLGVSPGMYVCLKVRDTGQGMEPYVLDRIFDPFFTTKGPHEGTGMGLAVVHGIVQSHYGVIKVQSQPGKGSTFEVFLPVIESELKSHTQSKEIIPTGTERILFIDDEKPLVDMGELMLKRLGYHVSTRTSSIEALELFKAQPERFDVVITDMTMPNMTGEKLTEELLKIRSDIPVILCTGYSQQLTEERAKKMGVREYILKPISINELAKSIRSALGDK